MNWDKYFYDICNVVASKSPCLSRKIGAIIVRDKSIISTGYNGPPRGIPHCGIGRLTYDKYLMNVIDDYIGNTTKLSYAMLAVRFETECPRKVLGFKSGEGLHLCHAQHAEENAITNAARIGATTIGATLYLNTIVPCKNCFGTLINAGITEIVSTDTKPYDDATAYLINNSKIKIRRFKI